MCTVCREVRNLRNSLQRTSRSSPAGQQPPRVVNSLGTGQQAFGGAGQQAFGGAGQQAFGGAGQQAFGGAGQQAFGGAGQQAFGGAGRGQTASTFSRSLQQSFENLNPARNQTMAMDAAAMHVSSPKCSPMHTPHEIQGTSPLLQRPGSQPSRAYSTPMQQRYDRGAYYSHPSASHGMRYSSPHQVAQSPLGTSPFRPGPSMHGGGPVPQTSQYLI